MQLMADQNQRGEPLDESVSPRARGWLSLALVLHVGIMGIAWSVSGGASALQMRLLSILGPYLGGLHVAPPVGLAWVDGAAMGQPHRLELSGDRGETWRSIPPGEAANRSSMWHQWVYLIGHYQTDLEHRDAAALLAAAGCPQWRVKPGDQLRISALLPEPRGDQIVRNPIERYRGSCLRDGEQWAMMANSPVPEVAEAERGPPTKLPPAVEASLFERSQSDRDLPATRNAE
jgi:hypothetical protein